MRSSTSRITALRFRFATVAAVMLLCAGTVSAATDYYLKFGDLDGGITSGRFVGWSKIVDVTGDVHAPASPDPATPPAPTFAIQVVKHLDKSSPLLMKACGDGTVAPRVTLVWSDGSSVYFKINLVDVFVSSFRTEADGKPDSPPTETFSLNFQKIEWTCVTPERAEGGLKAIFDVATQQSLLKEIPPFRAGIEHRAGIPGIHVTWPVEAGHRYRILQNNALSGPWMPIQEYTAPEDGTADQFIPQGVGRLFLRVEELD